jgi:hypothetical protein
VGRKANRSGVGGPGASEVRHLNQEQLAQRLGVSERTIEGWRYRGNGPDYLRLEGRIVYRLVDVERFEFECLQKGGAKTRAARP